jgi:hypothetical protein
MRMPYFNRKISNDLHIRQPPSIRFAVSYAVAEYSDRNPSWERLLILVNPAAAIVATTRSVGAHASIVSQ